MQMYRQGGDKQKQKPLSIPLPFEQAVEGLLAVKPGAKKIKSKKEKARRKK